MYKYACVIVCMVMMLTCAANAQVIDPLRSSWSVNCINPPHSVWVSHCPAGDFEPVGNGCGGPNTAFIQIQLIDFSGLPVPGIPPTDIWYQPANPAEVLAIKPGTWCTDFPTDLTGRTTTTRMLSAGGCVLQGLQCVVLDPMAGPVILQNPPVVPFPTVMFNSPDLNGDLVVNLSDLAIFGASYANPTGGYNQCCDYNDDGIINLSDLAFLATHYGHF